MWPSSITSTRRELCDGQQQMPPVEQLDPPAEKVHLFIRLEGCGSSATSFCAGCSHRRPGDIFAAGDEREGREVSRLGGAVKFKTGIRWTRLSYPMRCVFNCTR